MAPVFAVKLLVLLSITMATLDSVIGQIPQMVKLLEDANDISANISATLPQLPILLRNQTDLQNISNILMGNNTATANEMASILPQIQWILQEQLKKQDEIQDAQQENNDAGMVVLQDHQRIFDQIASTLTDTATMQTSLTEIAAIENKTLVQMYDVLTQTADTQSQKSNTLTQISRTLTQMAAIQIQMAESQNQTSNTISQIAATQSQMANFLSQALNLLQMQSQQLENLLPVDPRDCSDLALRGNHKSGPYVIIPTFGSASFNVFCDMDTYGGGWTLFQRRFDGSVDFFLEWSDYESGFGSAFGEYWAGLSQIHSMTQTGIWQLRIDLEAFDGDTAYAMYDSFSVGDASSKYQLHIGAYHGTAGNSLMPYHNGMAFSTKDRDNDIWDSSCAQTFKGAWWYDSCHKVNLNALYLGPTGNDNTGNRWQGWKGSKSLKSSEMKMRRIQ